MSAQHTPGPWVTDTDGDGKPFAIVTSTHDKDGLDDDVCEVYGGNDDDDSVREANARLIAAAPDLLEALKLARGALRQAANDVSDWGAYAPAHFQTKHRLADDVRAYNNAADAAHAAIAKAEGGAA